MMVLDNANILGPPCIDRQPRVVLKSTIHITWRTKLTTA